MLERILYMMRKEFIQVLRDPRMRAVILAVPIFQLLILSQTLTMDVHNILLAVYDPDNTTSSRELVKRFSESGYFKLIGYVEREADINYLLDSGKAQMAINLGSDFQERISAGRPAQVQVIVDGTDSNTAGVILGYASKILTEYSKSILISRITKLTGNKRPPGAIDPRPRAWFNDNLISRNFYLPGLVSILIMLIALLLTAMAVVREKEIGTMEQIMVTPIRPVEFILGKTVPFAVISVFDAAVAIVIAFVVLKVPIRGSILLLFLSVCVFLLTALGIGLLISTVSSTQQQAMMTMFFFFYPAMLLSGFMFPIANMPRVIQWITYVNPMRYFIIIIRGIFLKGVGLEILWPYFVVLLIIGFLTIAVAARRFRKTVL